MTSNELDGLRADLASAEADVERLRTDNAQIAEHFREEPSDAMRELLKRGAASLSAARDRVAIARTALSIFEKTGTPYGILTESGKVIGTIAASIPPGATRKDRERALTEALGLPLSSAADELGVTLSASPERFTRERPGRDPEGRTVFDVSGRVEGDLLVPSVSGAPSRRS